jgi:hypothetical protein
VLCPEAPWMEASTGTAASAAHEDTPLAEAFRVLHPLGAEAVEFE